MRAEAGPLLAILEETIACQRRLGDPAARAIHLLNLGAYHAMFTDTSTARRLYEECLTVDRTGVIGVAGLGNLGALLSPRAGCPTRWFTCRVRSRSKSGSAGAIAAGSR